MVQSEPFVGVNTTQCVKHGTKYRFQCTNKFWVKCEYRCDLLEQCIDGSDEKGCPNCRTYGYICPDNATCISYNQLCDGTKDCSKGEDEIDEL